MSLLFVITRSLVLRFIVNIDMQRTVPPGSSQNRLTCGTLAATSPFSEAHHLPRRIHPTSHVHIAHFSAVYVALRVNCDRVQRNELVWALSWGWTAESLHTLAGVDIIDADATTNSRRPGIKLIPYIRLNHAGRPRIVSL